MANVKKSSSCYNVFIIMVSICLSCSLRIFLSQASRRFSPGSHQRFNSTLLKASSALGTSLCEKRTILPTFPRKLRSFILTFIDIKNWQYRWRDPELFLSSCTSLRSQIQTPNLLYLFNVKHCLSLFNVTVTT